MSYSSTLRRVEMICERTTGCSAEYLRSLSLENLRKRMESRHGSPMKIGRTRDIETPTGIVRVIC